MRLFVFLTGLWTLLCFRDQVLGQSASSTHPLGLYAEPLCQAGFLVRTIGRPFNHWNQVVLGFVWAFDTSLIYPDRAF